MTVDDGGSAQRVNSGEEARGMEALQRFQELCIAGSERELTEEEVTEINGFTAAFPALDRTLGVRYQAIAPERLELRLEISNDHIQPWGITNGGVYAALGENAGSMASYMAAGAGPAVMGTSNETHFLRPTTPGDVVVSVATPEHVGRSSHLWRIEHINEATGKRCALTFLKTHVARG